MATTYPDDRSLTSSAAADLVPPLTAVAAARLLVLRNYLVYRKAWKLFITGFLEPFFYLLSIGIGVGQLIESFEFNGQVIDYASFVAPGMLAASAFNGALIDMTFNVFFKLKFDKLYDQMLATPLSTSDIARGEIAWGQLRGGVYSARVPGRDGRDGHAALVVGGARAAGGDAHRVRVRGRLHGADDVHAVLAGLRQDHPRPAAAVPVLGHVLPRHGVPRRRSAGWSS